MSEILEQGNEPDEVITSFGYSITDPDCFQIQKKVEKNKYYMYEYQQVSEYCYFVVGMTICLDYYSKEEVEDFVKSYYQGGIKQINEIYKSYSNDIIAECIFETLCYSESDLCFLTVSSRDIAIKNIISKIAC